MTKTLSYLTVLSAIVFNIFEYSILEKENQWLVHYKGFFWLFYKFQTLKVIVNSASTKLFFAKSFIITKFVVKIFTNYFIFKNNDFFEALFSDFFIEFLADIIFNEYYKVLDEYALGFHTNKILLESIDGYIIKVNPTLNIEYINQDFFNIPKEEMFGTVLSDYPFYQKEVFDEILKTKKQKNWEWSCNINGEKQFYSSKSTSLFQGDEFTGLIILSTSTKEKVEILERESKHIQKEISLKSKTELISTISHEIRSPLQSLSYSIEDLLQLNPNEKQKDVLLDIKNVYTFLTRIISDILDMSKIDAGKLKISKHRVSVLEIVENTLNIISARITNVNLIIDYKLDFNICSSFIGDKFRIIQILLNFITNSMKFTKEGVIELSAKPVLHESNPFVRFQVSDEGIGISSNNLSKIFTPFFQSEVDSSTPTEFKGWGLGLSISKGLIDLLDGKIGVDSIEGKGSKFWIDIPLIEPSKEFIYSSFSQTSYKSVLLISFEQSILNNLEKTCLFMGFKTIKKFEDIVDCLKLIKKRNFDLIVLDEYFVDSVDIFQKYEKIIIIGDKNEKLGEKFLFLPPPFLISKFEKLVQKNPRVEDKKKDLTGLKVLVVEDHALIRKTICKLLEKLNTSLISSAENGKEAIEIFEKNEFDIVLMDIQMPVMNGIEATEYIRSLEDVKKKSTPIIAVTGNFVNDKEHQLLEWKMNEILIKPVKIDLLMNTILNIIETSMK